MYWLINYFSLYGYFKGKEKIMKFWFLLKKSKLIVIVLIKWYLDVGIDEYIIGCNKRWPYLERPVLKL